MNLPVKKIYVVVVSAMLTACGGGDTNIAPVTEDNSVDNSTSTNTSGGVDVVNPCASYVNSGGQVIQGIFSAADCTYAPSFVDAGNNLTVDMTIPALIDGGVHIFEGSLFVGETYDTDADLSAAGISGGGDGPVLTIEAGATLAFTSNNDFMITNRGSQIFAVGSVTDPVTFTAVSDVQSSRAASPTLAFDAAQQWGVRSH